MFLILSNNYFLFIFDNIIHINLFLVYYQALPIKNCFLFYNIFKTKSQEQNFAQNHLTTSIPMKNWYTTCEPKCVRNT